MAAPRQTFSFLYRTDKGRIDRATWWQATAPLLALTLALTVGWVLLSPYSRHDLAETQFIAPLTILAYVYLLLYAFALLLIGVCEYNLSAKRFRDRGRPGAFAAALPLSLLFGGAFVWFIPQSFDSIPDWTASIAVAAVVLVVVWNVVELGLRSDRARP